jgi:hypothetical protein
LASLYAQTSIDTMGDGTMRTKSRLTAAGVTVAAALAVGAVAFATPAVTAAPSSTTQVQAGLFKKREWTGSAALDKETGLWRAYITNGRDSALLPSTYADEDAAKNDAQATADRMNGNFMDGPGCQPPVLC